MTIAQAQEWLNRHGASLTVDGKGGPKTRQAVIDVFRNTEAPSVTKADYLIIADRLGGTVAQVKAVAEVEAPRGGWDNNGLLACLYERHYAWKKLRIAIPFLSDPKPGGYTIDVDKDGINDSWEKIADGVCRFGLVAFEVASWGRFQIMGAHWKKLGYDSAADFVWLLSRNEYAHFDAMARYVETFGLTGAFRAISNRSETCRAFAKGYNGPGYRKYRYDEKIAVAHKKYSA